VVPLGVSDTSKRFSARPVLIWSWPKLVPGSVRCGEKVRPERLAIPGMVEVLCAPPTPPGRCARNFDGKYE
jgi:hypothetical protein